MAAVPRRRIVVPPLPTVPQVPIAVVPPLPTVPQVPIAAVPPLPTVAPLG
jgi:hypothetical protein